MLDKFATVGLERDMDGGAEEPIPFNFLQL
jgi:hypothetical protein